MRSFTRPAVVAGVLAAAGVLVHPALRVAQWGPHGEVLVSGVCLLALFVLLAAVPEAVRTRQPGPLLLALGTLVVVGGLAFDGVRGYEGSVDLVPGQSLGTFEERRPDGRVLGLRPFGFTMGLADAGPGGGAALLFPGGEQPEVVTSVHAVGYRGFRFGSPRFEVTGEARRLRIGITGPAGQTAVDVSPEEPAMAGDLTISIEQYFPDFALDDNQQPFSRSLEPRNPAALLTVRAKKGQSFRVFVLQKMPGLHRVEELDRSFALLEVVPAQAVILDVHHEPAALVALVGLALALCGVLVRR